MKTALRYLLIILAIVLNPAAFNSTYAAPSAATSTQQPKEDLVIFNTKTLKYHSLSCKWAAKCTKSCISISRIDAVKRGGTPCKVCHAK